MIASDKTIKNADKLKFIIGGILFFTALIILVISVTQTTSEFYITVRELNNSPEAYMDRNLRVSGAVLGGSIVFDPESGLLNFSIAHIPGDMDEIEVQGGLENALHHAVSDPHNPRLAVVYEGAIPDMLRHEAQAVLTGKMTSEGVFMAQELLLKCPSRYEEALPDQVD